MNDGVKKTLGQIVPILGQLRLTGTPLALDWRLVLLGDDRDRLVRGGIPGTLAEEWDARGGTEQCDQAANGKEK